MNLTTERQQGALIAVVAGRIDGLTTRNFQETLAAVVGEEDRIVVDFEAVTYISSAGLRAVLMVAKAARRRGATFSLCTLSTLTREIFSVSGFDKIITIHASRSEALEA